MNLKKIFLERKKVINFHPMEVLKPIFPVSFYFLQNMRSIFLWKEFFSFSLIFKLQSNKRPPLYFLKIIFFPFHFLWTKRVFIDDNWYMSLYFMQSWCGWQFHLLLVICNKGGIEKCLIYSKNKALWSLSIRLINLVNR